MAEALFPVDPLVSNIRFDVEDKGAALTTAIFTDTDYKEEVMNRSASAMFRISEALSSLTEENFTTKIRIAGSHPAISDERRVLLQETAASIFRLSSNALRDYNTLDQELLDWTIGEPPIEIAESIRATVVANGCTTRGDIYTLDDGTTILDYIAEQHRVTCFLHGNFAHILGFVNGEYTEANYHINDFRFTTVVAKIDSLLRMIQP